jgi:serine protease Do
LTITSPAAEAGRASGAVIVKFNGSEVKKMVPFRNLVAQTSPGSKLEMQVLRDGQRETLEITIGTLPTDGTTSNATVDEVDTLGFSVQPLNDALAERLGYADRSGVIVSNVESGSTAARAGLEPGMLIEQVNHSPVTGMGDFTRAMKEHPDAAILLRVRKGDYSRFVVIPQDN